MAQHRLFAYFTDESQFPPELRFHNQPFLELATHLASCPAYDEAERTVALRKLMESRDSFLRSQIQRPESSS
jgi:hypothetical protein